MRSTLANLRVTEAVSWVLADVRMDKPPPQYPFPQEPGFLHNSRRSDILYVAEAAHSEVWVSFDVRFRMGVDHHDDQGQVVQAVRETARELLRKRTPFVWDATHLSRSTRAKTLELLNSYGARIDIVYIEVPEVEFRARNRARGGSRVPDIALDRMLQRWEPPLPTEGHSVSYVVSGREIRFEDIASLQKSRPGIEPMSDIKP
jgi:predicted kinase